MVQEDSLFGAKQTKNQLNNKLSWKNRCVILNENEYHLISTLIKDYQKRKSNEEGDRIEDMIDDNMSLSFSPSLTLFRTNREMMSLCN